MIVALEAIFKDRGASFAHEITNLSHIHVEQAASWPELKGTLLVLEGIFREQAHGQGRVTHKHAQSTSGVVVVLCSTEVFIPQEKKGWQEKVENA